jgi:3-deoxy-7-phosphoheptulonate synthase
MQNFPLLIEAGKTGKPILLKRGWSSTVEEWLGAAEYVAMQGNLDIMLCERGIRTFTMAEYARSTLDIAVFGALRKLTFLPIIADPSHACGDAELVPATALAALGVGADGMLVEVIGEHTEPCDTLCDGHQSIRPSVLKPLIAAWRGGDAGRNGSGANPAAADTIQSRLDPHTVIPPSPR